MIEIRYKGRKEQNLKRMEWRGKRNMKKLQGVILIITAMLSAVLLSACGKNPEDKESIPK